MRNLKKLVTIIVTIAILASMFAVPALAEESADALKLEAINVLRGTGNGVDEAYRASVPTRYQVGWLFLRLLGKEEAAQAWAGSLNFKDAATAVDAKGNKLNAENQKMLGYLYAHQALGYRGFTDDTFRPFESVDAQMYYKLMLVALGYVEGTDFTWDTVFDKAIEIGLIAAAPEAGEEFTIDDLAQASVKALDANLADGSKTLIAKLVDDDKAIDADVAAEAGLYGRRTYSTALDPVNAEADIPNVGPAAANQLMLPEVLSGDYAEVEFDMSSSGNEGLVGFVDKDVVDYFKYYTHMSLQIRMTGGRFDVRNGGAFKYDTLVNWENDEFYHVRARIDFVNHTYSVWVDGVQIANNYAFRANDPIAKEADDLAMVVLASGAGGVQMKNLELNKRDIYTTDDDPVVIKADIPGVGPALANQFYLDDVYSGKVTLTYDMTALADSRDGGVGFVAAPVAGYFKYYTHFSIYVAMAPNFRFINGGVWVEGPTVVKGQTYEVKVTADMDAHTYDVAIDGTTVATGLTFRTRGQSPVITDVRDASNLWMVSGAASTDDAIKFENLVVDDNREYTKVTGVTAVDMGEVHIAFDRVVTASKFTNNIEINDAKVTSITLDADGKGLLAAVPAAKIQGNGGSYKVEVLKAAGLEKDFVETLTIFDTARPTVVELATVAPRQFSITFSEVLDSAVAGNISINNGIFGVADKTISGKVVTVTVASTALPAEELDVKISGYTDLSGFTMAEVTEKFTPAPDTTAPTVNVASKTQTQVVLEFDEAVTGTGLTNVGNYYHTFSHYHPDSATVSGKKVTLTFTSYPLPAGTTTLTVLKGNIQDLWGNKMAADVAFDLDVVADTTAPSVTKIEFKSETEVKVTFSEEVDGAGTVGNFVVKLGDTAKNPNSVSYASKVATLTWTTKLAGGTYSIEIKNIKDKALTPNAMATYTSSFVATDMTPVASATAEIVKGGTNDIIYLTYNEAMNATVLDASYYMIDYDADGTADATLAAKTVKIEAFGADGKSYKITRAADASLVAGSQLQIGRVEDLAGNKYAGFYFTANIAAATAPAVTAINQTAPDKIAVVFNTEVTTYSLDAFEFRIGGQVYKAAQIDSVATASGKTTIGLTLTYDTVQAFKAAASGYDTNTALTLSDVTGLQVYLVADKIVSSIGTKSVATDITATTADKRAPKLLSVKVDATDANKAIMTFSEAIDGTNDTFIAFDLEVKKGTTVQVPITAYTTVVSGNTVEVTFTATPKDFTFTLNSSTYLKGADGNAPIAFSAVKCVLP